MFFCLYRYSWKTVNEEQIRWLDTDDPDIRYNNPRVIDRDCSSDRGIIDRVFPYAYCMCVYVLCVARW